MFLRVISLYMVIMMSLNGLILCLFEWFLEPAQPDGLENVRLWLGSTNIKFKFCGSSNIKYNTIQLEFLGSARLEQIKVQATLAWLSSNKNCRLGHPCQGYILGLGKNNNNAFWTIQSFWNLLQAWTFGWEQVSHLYFHLLLSISGFKNTWRGKNISK